jgi:hypothetical protein
MNPIKSELENLTIQNGYSYSGGGMLCNGRGLVTLKNLIVRNNIAAFWASGLLLKCDSNLLNVLIYGNEVDSLRPVDHGAALFCSGASSHNLINVTISDNSIKGLDDECQVSGGLFVVCDDVTIVNSIFDNNYPSNIKIRDPGLFNPEVLISHSNIEGGEEGIIRDTLETTLHWLEGNIDQDPLFIGGDPFDYHLSEGSPCSDAGTPLFVWEGDTIFNLSPEEYDGDAPDMGAFGIDPVSSSKEKKIIPSRFQLFQNYPNPFNSRTVISWQLAVGNNVDLSIYNILGQKVATLVSGKQKAGVHRVEWDASEYASGLYFYMLSAGGYTKVRKLLLIR